ncbi:MAG: hypothetical protein QOJ02_3538 [Acidobacteriota bacterium]|jgi:hypothetical protein|nr:hypothetical protein [Acidobacteriota bacterium]
MAEKTSELIRSVTKRLRKYVNDRRRALRRDARSEARLPFIITLRVPGKSAVAKSLADAPAIVGHTRDMSASGLTLLLPSVRIGDLYLTDVESRLEVKLALPDGPLKILTASVRFEQLKGKEAGCSYLLAVRIVEMQNDARDRYIAYLKTIRSKGRRARERRQAQAGALTGPNSKAQSGTWEALTPASVSSAFEQFYGSKKRRL